ncbi:5-methyltetrahydropteroyltriglutamate--homocysteine S-methyltransferase [Frischella sp. Ac48]|uniref:5-methyltetrahydropteroyltriglutamate-- homocysteine S-methyltransferase n=1 Tax=Frischella sp. Ac48 TaxID=2804531 RepID=UPI001C7D26C7|nr:5-methyltetrahydropteroyltriglutamate--homocysteine S-methyltransferase [Frischella sp. Ac48]MBX4132262.1 5-methyltetrahydropteroyltriglutamate--homocysteine S-methyltransferase [Frischella sp. Ac48]
MKTLLNPPFRADVVGSYLRPDFLIQARTQFVHGKITQKELTDIENRAITELVAKQKAAGLHVITDGEFRRSWWHLDFMWGLQGVEKASLKEGYKFQGVESRPETARLTGKISGENHPFIEHFRFLLPFAESDIVPRITIPAPAQFFKELYRPENKAATESIYPSQTDLLQDIANAYQTFIQQIYAIGCRNVQLDDCTWGMMVDSRYNNAGVANSASKCDCNCASNATVISQSIQDLAEIFVQLNNAAIVNAPPDLVLTTHVCRGNYRSTWAASGGYQPVASYLFARENVHAYYLEFDTERAGDFSPLAKVSGDKQVVLGLISSKVGELEDKQAVIKRIKEASQYLPLERLCLSTQCGFASTEEGNALTEEQQWAKIALVTDIAKEVWGTV